MQGGHHGSRWPIYVSLGATLLLLGIVNGWLALPGAAVLTWAVSGWLREDVNHLPAPVQGRSDRWYGVAFLIMGEVVLFGVLFFFWFWARSHSPAWPPEGTEMPELGVIFANTAALLASGWTVHQADTRLRKGDTKAFRRYMSATILLGVIFLGGQAFEYAKLGFSPATNPFGSAFYALTGIHGLHVLFGLGALAIILGLVARKRIGAERAPGIGAAVLYWHFVDVVWLGILAVVYLRWV